MSQPLVLFKECSICRSSVMVALGLLNSWQSHPRRGFIPVASEVTPQTCSSAGEPALPRWLLKGHRFLCHFSSLVLTQGSKKELGPPSLICLWKDVTAVSSAPPTNQAKEAVNHEVPRWAPTFSSSFPDLKSVGGLPGRTWGRICLFLCPYGLLIAFPVPGTAQLGDWL